MEKVTKGKKSSAQHDTFDRCVGGADEDWEGFRAEQIKNRETL